VEMDINEEQVYSLQKMVLRRYWKKNNLKTLIQNSGNYA
jgi:hypothetical protein